MHKNNDYLSPDSSPQKLQTTGVKRVNNMPLFIAIGVLTVFVLLIAFVALKRANAQNLVTEPAKLTTAKKNTMSLAYEVIGNRKPETNQPVVNAPEPTLPVPPPQNTHENQSLDAQSVPDAEMERIRQEKHKLLRKQSTQKHPSWLITHD